MINTLCPRCFGRGHLIDDREEGASLRAMRQQAGLPQEAIAGRAGCSIAYISDIEGGRRHCSMKVRQAYLDIARTVDPQYPLAQTHLDAEAGDGGLTRLGGLRDS